MTYEIIITHIKLTVAMFLLLGLAGYLAQRVLNKLGKCPIINTLNKRRRGGKR